ncbi:MAG: ATP-binding protein [Rhodocyclaceae bacterium]|nr:ATP-binding protein [Rhodocyclaceae bacterium]MBX3670036.1 ATP-binding protein [Rhodocyclaceae bacterium]
MFDDHVKIAVTPHALVLSEDTGLLASVGTDLAAAGWTVSAQPVAMVWRSVAGAANRPQLVVVDATQLDMRAVEFLQMIAANVQGPATALLFLLPPGADCSVLRTICTGTTCYVLGCPFDSGQLRCLAASALESCRWREELRRSLGQFGPPLPDARALTLRVRTLPEATQASQFLAAFGPEPDMLVIGLMELIANGIEHGNLGISYREKTELLLAGAWSDEVDRRLKEPAYRDLFVSVEMRRERDRLQFAVTDQGKGFDPRPYLALDPQRAFDPNGRGIAMARTISFSELDYIGRGNRVLATVKI